MPINWSAENRETLEKAIKSVYLNPTALARFVDYVLDGISIKSITDQGNIADDIYELLVWAKTQHLLDKLYQGFCSRNDTNPTISKLKQSLEGDESEGREFLIPNSGKNLHRSDWDELWGNFTVQLLPYMYSAFPLAYKSAFSGSYLRTHPHTPLEGCDDIRKYMEDVDTPTLAVRFVEQVLAKVADLGEDGIDELKYELKGLRAWRDRIAKKYRILPGKPRLSKASKQGYLLVCLKESGKRTKDEKDFVIPFAELRVSGESDAIPFHQNTETCSLRQVESRLSDFICSAEEVLAEYGCSQVTLELFLPCVHLDVDVAGWNVLNAHKELQPLGTHRRFAVRSLERATSLDARKSLSKKWTLLKACVEANDACYQFHHQESWPNSDELKKALEEVPGIMLSATLPPERAKRQKVLSGIVGSAVPIALWFSNSSSLNVSQRRTKFDTLLRNNRLTDFADLSYRWSQLREHPKETEGRHLRLLCDCPERWPELPDREEDSIVAPF